MLVVVIVGKLTVMSRWDPYAVCRGGCLELHYCKMVEWYWWESHQYHSTILQIKLESHRGIQALSERPTGFLHMTCKKRPRNNL